MIGVDDAQRFVLSGLTSLAPTSLSLEDALGCVASEDVWAKEAVPGFANSSMDGFALRASDTSSGRATLRVAGALIAGDSPSARVEPGHAVRIMTGAPIPDGADCVCMIEQTVVDSTAGTVEITRRLEVGDNVRYPGEDVKVGQVLISRGDEFDAVRLGVLAGQGFASVVVVPRPRVAVVSTGNELTSSSGTLRHGEIRDTNRPTLLGLLRESGFNPIDLGSLRDDYDEIRATFARAVEECDALISTGGVSVGDVDHVKHVIAELGGESARSMQVAVRPGKPFAFGLAGSRRVPIFGLPGNPVSTRVSYELFVRPALRVLGGHRRISRPHVRAILDCEVPRSRDGKLHVIPARAYVHEDGRVHVESIVRPGSHLLSAVAGTNVFLMSPDGDGLRVDDEVAVIVLDLETSEGSPVAPTEQG